MRIRRLGNAEGNVVSPLRSSGADHSTYEPRTKWADQVGPDNAHPE